jgi:flavorubredoxin
MIQEIKHNIFTVGANDPERKLFDALLPLKHGTTYNSYFIKGSEKTVLIDTVDPSKTEILLANLKQLNVEKIDYIIANHAEQDHSGSLPFVLERYPNAKILCSDKCVPMLVNYLQIPEEKFQIVVDGETLSLGDKTLQFIYTPWVHWPETMVTFAKEDKTLFSCDFFGTHFGLDDLLSSGEKETYDGAKSYFAEIMMPFCVMIREHMKKLESYPIEMIAPSHGPIHSKPETILANYRDWASETVKNEALIMYVSMHGSTKAMAEHLSKTLETKGVKTYVYDISTMELGEVASHLIDSATVIIGTPCLLGGIHPSAAHLIFLMETLKPKTKFISILGSFGWSGGIMETITPMLKNFQVELIQPVITKGLPKQKDFEEIEKLADAISRKHTELFSSPAK